MIADYEGRTVDMQAWSIASDNNVLVDASTSGTICTGIVKLAQRFMITFLNEPNSIKYDYWGYGIDRGSSFMQALREGWLHTETDVFNQFAISELQVRSQLQAEEAESEDEIPLDEQYKQSVLTNVTLANSELTLEFTIESQSDSVTIILPIPVMVPA